MNKKISTPTAIIIILILAVIVGGYTFWQYSNIQKEQNISLTQGNIPEINNEDQLEPTQLPSFLESLNSAEDVKIDFQYEGDGYYASYSYYRENSFYTPEGSNEKYLKLSSKKKEAGQYSYGAEYYSIFLARGSHSYQGVPVYISDINSKYSVSYVGLNINNPDLISELKIEFGIDYNTSGIMPIGQNQSPKLSILDKIFGVESVYACGPGIYLRLVGDSKLIFEEEKDGISWYRLENPINLYNLNLHYCDEPFPDREYCDAHIEDDPACWKGFCYYDATISNLANGNLRMHIYYKPNDKEGLLKLQMANLILRNSDGNYYQPIMGENSDHYYRAYLKTPEMACLAKGTKITMGNSSNKNIEDIKEGDLVSSFDFKNGEYKDSEVIEIIKREDPIVNINSVLKAAPDELIYMTDGSTKMAMELEIGDILFNEIKVDSIEHSATIVDTYDLILENANNFFANGYLVSAPE